MKLQETEMCSRKKPQNILKYKRPYKRSTANMECKKIIYASSNRDKWHQLKPIQKISGEKKSRNCRKQPYWALHAHLGKYFCESTGKARHQGTTENSHIGQLTCYEKY
jgi:hypothetical protein